MKTRIGFVSNSSSSSFICYLPDKWNPSDSEILECASEYFEETCEKEILIEVRKAISEIKLGRDIGEYENYAVWNTIGNLIPTEFVQSSQDVPSDCGVISGINIEKIFKLMEQWV